MEKDQKTRRTNIKKNLKFVSKKINVKLNNLKLMHQTHSNKVIFVSKNNRRSKNFYSDALITNIKGYALGVVTADCVPIILYDSKKINLSDVFMQVGKELSLV